MNVNEPDRLSNTQDTNESCPDTLYMIKILL